MLLLFTEIHYYFVPLGLRYKNHRKIIWVQKKSL